MSRRRRNPLTRLGTDFETVMVLGAVGLVGYLLYQAYKGIQAAADAAKNAAGAAYRGAQTITGPISSGIAATIVKLTAQPAMNVPGNVIFPDGTAAPLSTYNRVYTDQAGNVYVKDRGSTWQLGQSDADGDWPATYVSG